MNKDLTCVRMDGRKIASPDTFHDVFSHEFSFPHYYGRNMDAWIDCMSDLKKFTAIHIVNYEYLKKTAPDQWLDLIECSAFVNWRNLDAGQPPLLALAFHK